MAALNLSVSTEAFALGVGAHTAATSTIAVPIDFWVNERLLSSFCRCLSGFLQCGQIFASGSIDRLQFPHTAFCLSAFSITREIYHLLPKIASNHTTRGIRLICAPRR